MARPIKWRKIEYMPKYNYFKPGNIPACELEENILKIEEYEAIRLKDLEGLDQEACAQKMNVSRQTFQRIYGFAKKKVADSLINGKAILIKGGNYTKNICMFRCLACDHTWEIRVEDIEDIEEIKNINIKCPECESREIKCESKTKQNYCRKRCQNRRGKNIE
ncbi:DUF134 domain-containing protein [Abyssisolibacter fermentans]|uniref:DUF134 domain-containing protein n=1 Tax=Abyssisolibacter fermentans TaxID=1766203 RepID=UPI0008360AA0|nr:DUF134 domain-containing protein [Abyssisolibacter fermentans]